MSKVTKAVGAVVTLGLAVLIGGPAGAAVWASHALIGAKLMALSNWGLSFHDREGREWGPA
jgi:hypothetical protein